MIVCNPGFWIARSSISLLQGIFPTQGSNPGLLHCSQGKPKNTGVGNLSLLQEIFLSQESNRGLLHCRQILYEWIYQGSPTYWKSTPYNWLYSCKIANIKTWPNKITRPCEKKIFELLGKTHVWLIKDRKLH